MNLVETLANGIGVRTAGSDAAARAAEEVARAFRGVGLEPRFQEFPLLAYEPEEPELTIDGERWPAGPCLYSHSGEVDGEIRLLSDGVWAIGDEGRLRRTPFGRGPIPFLTGLKYGGYIATEPTAFVSVADAERLQDGMHARLVVRGRFVDGRRDRNVIAEVAGASDEAIVVGAHYDAVWRGRGAIDNASGVEGLRRVAERLVGREHPRTLRFIAFGAEEIGLVGARRYVLAEKEAGRLEKIVGMVNLDCIAHGDKLQLLAAPAALLGRAEELARARGLLDRYEVQTEIGEEAGTDHLPFTQNNIPAISVLHFPYDEYHLTDDTPELVDEQLMNDAVDLATALVESQLARPVPR